MTTLNATQQDEGVIRSLNRAGIRPRYHRLSLKDHKSPYATELFDWVMGASGADHSEGYTLIGGNDTEDLAILLARGLHVTGRAVRVMSCVSFQEYLSSDRSYLTDITADATTILITQMGPNDPREREIYTKRETRVMENWLGIWMAEGHRLLIHSPVDLASGWFSGAFLQRVATANQTLREDI